MSTPAATALPPPTFLQQRLLSLDTFRGLIMVTLAFNGFGLLGVARNYLKTDPDSPFWRFIDYHFEHVEWAGCAFWDMIQPSFMFMVGVSMAYSYAARQARGDSWLRMFFHALQRSVVLILLALLLRSNFQSTTNWMFMDVISQIGLGYTFLFLLWGRSFWAQVIAAVGILSITWLIYTEYPAAGIDLERGNPDVGVSAAWAKKHLADIPPAWHKNANVGHSVDILLLNQFPRDKPFYYNSGGYQTINFLPALATMLFGLMAGELLRSSWRIGWRIGLLFVAGLAGLGLGELLHQQGISPIVKRIWTPSWTLFSTGWCLIILGSLYLVIDVWHWRRWTYPLVVVGTNSIAIYCMAALIKPWVVKTLQTHLGARVFQLGGEWGTYEFDPNFGPMVQSTMVGLVFWLICWWMYRNKVFIRI